MPILRRRERLRREDLENLTDEQKRHLTFGWTFFDDRFGDLDSFATAWRMHAAALTDSFRRSGRTTISLRPLGWWLVEHKRERPIVGTWANAEWVTFQRHENAAHFGYLHTHSYSETGEPAQEPEADYLGRLNLLTDEEREWLARKAAAVS